MNELKIIDQRELLGKQFRIYGDFDNPLFLASDVAEWIEHTDVSTMLRTIDEDEKLIQTLFVSGQNRQVWMLTEDGLYELLMQSRKPIAKQFKTKIKEILKDIRKHGVHMTDNLLQKTLNDPQFLINVLTQYKEEKEKNKILIQSIEHKEDVIIGLTKDVDLEKKQQRINQIVRHNTTNFQKRWNLLYDEFNRVYHLNVKVRHQNAIERGEVEKGVNLITYICKYLKMTNELHKVCVKLFEADAKKLYKNILDLI